MYTIFKDSTILLVDDVPENLTVLGSIFSSLNSELIAVQDGKQAIEIAESEKPDLILLDISMPGMNGFEVCKSLKSNPETKDIPVIIVSAKVSSEDITRGFESGAVDYVTKPFNHTELIARADTHLTLSKAIKEREKLLHDKDKFISLIAHDIKSPLSGVMSLMKLISEDYDAFDEVERREMLNDIYESLNAQYKFVVDLLDWGRLQLGRIELNKESIDPKIIVEAVTSLHKLNAENKGVNLKTVFNTEDKFEADPTHIDTILTNLVSNAVKFTKQGGDVKVQVDSYAGKIKISVQDTGVGMSEEDKAKLFKNDIIHTTPGTNQEIGTGLGLLLVRELAEKNGGKLDFDSELGKGTTFFVTFPIS
jgi:signal transduction histidine kinase